MGGVHGGWALTLIDSAAGCAGHIRCCPPMFGYATIETKANFTRPITGIPGACAPRRVVGRGRQIISAEARVPNSTGRVLAHGTSTIMVVSLKGEG